MPVVNGLQACSQIKDLIMKQQEKPDTGIKVIRPLIVFLTQMNYEKMKPLIYENEQADIVLSKPLSIEKL